MPQVSIALNAETSGGLLSLGASRRLAMERQIRPEEELVGGNDEILPCYGRCRRRNMEGGGACGWTDAGRDRTPANTASAKPLWATSWTMRPQSRVVIRGDTISYGSSPFPGLSFLSRQLHNWQSYEGPVNQCLVLSATRDPRTPREPHTTRRFTTEHGTAEHVSCEPAGMVERRGEWRAGSRLHADSEVESAFLRACKYISLVPRRLSTGPEPESHGLWVRDGDPSAAIFGSPLHPPLPQDAHDPHCRSAGKSQADAILISSDDEFDDLGGRSDTSLKSLDGLLPDARNKVKSGRVTGTGKGVDAASVDSDAPELSVTSMAGLESPASPIALHAKQDRPVPASPASPASRRTLVCAGLSCRQGDGCARHPNLSASYRRLRNAKSSKAKADNEGSEGDEPEPVDAGLPLQPPYSQDRIDFRRDVGGQCNTNLEADHRLTCPPVLDDRGKQNGMCPAVPPQVELLPYCKEVTAQAKQGIRMVRPGRATEGKLPARVNTWFLQPAEQHSSGRTRLRCTSSQSLQAQQPPTQGPKRRQSQRSISKPQSSGGPALEEKTDEAALASFEEWPLEAVLKRVLVDGAATFQVEFTWNPCANHGRNDHPSETQRRKSPAGRTSSTARALPSRVASMTEEVQGEEYFKVEDIQDRRRGEDGWEYLVKWAGYRHKHNTWEPAAHFEQCPEILQEFHQRKGLPTTS
ncbi:predicted protein [Chaetomium globosum CBS 148.51]|uniref:Chromo domain-containing protein n=1 Tax=Chaetomium globosum (strain ATCC 6205 / CBS 148.51 / DSM 1962 / NBRC 6347 / NRRL 1970) TaxID=306901 RepID=Q2GNI2_CHAGB|nr:uncharacterized protein CHGG_10472 [Chaetomium globosum CBS 148.51]EAQ84068.1 predicted protein [Chaetomium globosum CBS 148.51]